MNQANIQDFLTKNISALRGVGSKTKKLLKKKKIEKICAKHTSNVTLTECKCKF